MNKKIKCECGNNCDYIQSEYEQVNNLPCNNSRMNMYNKKRKDMETSELL